MNDWTRDDIVVTIALIIMLAIIVGFGVVAIHEWGQEYPYTVVGTVTEITTHVVSSGSTTTCVQLNNQTGSYCSSSPEFGLQMARGYGRAVRLTVVSFHWFDKYVQSAAFLEDTE